MTSEDPSAPHEAPRDPVKIPQDAAITIQAALDLANSESFPIGKSTIQRWAKRWADQGSQSLVKSVLVTTRDGASYRLHREDFVGWIIEQKNNTRPGEVLQDPVKSHEAPKDLAGPRKTSRDFERPSEISRDTDRAASQSSEEITELRNEMMHLKIDAEVRKQLVNRAQQEIERLRKQTESLLMEKGALQYQLLQLPQQLGQFPPTSRT